jgi:predicted AlkP superfamily pyrophosphatase or phosphodiesterase
MRHAIKLLTLATTWTIALSSGNVSTQAPHTPPRLVVVVVIDQFRADYLTEYGAVLTDGLRRLMRDGAWFTNAAFPYLNTVTCPGHSTIGTGTFPYRHGMILNAWLDRRSGESPYCTDDPDAKDISYNGLTPAPGDSADRMLAPTLAEQIRQHGGRSVALSLKPRSAVSLAGHKADVVVWFDDRGGWSTSSAYAANPVPFVQRFVDDNPLSADFDKTWDRSLPLESYQHADDAVGEGLAAGWTRTFPHVLGSPGGKPDATFYQRWQRSPFADEYLGRMAAAAIEALRLGRGKGIDALAVGFSSLDVVGHTFGPRSHEVQDMLVRLDRTMGRLLSLLDNEVGAGNYVLGLSSDHGVADIPDQVKRGGRQPGKVAADAVTKVLTPRLGPGPHVAATAYTDIYLTPAASTALKRDPTLLAAAIDALRNLPAVERVFQGDDLAAATARTSTDPVLRAAALSYYAGRSGDFIIVPKEQWSYSTAVTTHGTHYAYDQRVPLIFFGTSIKAGEYPRAATPADLAPTLAAVAGVKIAPTDGRILVEALRQP